MKANKEFIQKIAERLNGMEEALEQYRDNPQRQDSFLENRGAYMVLQLVLMDMGGEVADRVLNRRNELKGHQRHC